MFGHAYPALRRPGLRSSGVRPQTGLTDFRDRRLRLDGAGEPPGAGQAIPANAGGSPAPR